MTNVTNIAQVNIVLDTSPYGYHNGDFIPVFQDALYEVAKLPTLNGQTIRVLLLILSCVDDKNSINLTITEIANELGCSYSSVYRAIRDLETMNIICHKGDRRGRKYELTSKLVNPRLAYRGNTRKLKKDHLPILFQTDGITPLLPDSVVVPDIEFE